MDRPQCTRYQRKGAFGRIGDVQQDIGDYIDSCYNSFKILHCLHFRQVRMSEKQYVIIACTASHVSSHAHTERKSHRSTSAASSSTTYNTYTVYLSCECVHLIPGSYISE